MEAAAEVLAEVGLDGRGLEEPIKVSPADLLVPVKLGNQTIHFFNRQWSNSYSTH